MREEQRLGEKKFLDGKGGRFEGARNDMAWKDLGEVATTIEISSHWEGSRNGVLNKHRILKNMTCKHGIIATKKCVE